MNQEDEEGPSRAPGGRQAQSWHSSARWAWAMVVMPPPLLVPTDNLHHNYLHLNVNSPKHHATTLGTRQGRAGTQGPSPPLLRAPDGAWDRAGGRPREPSSQSGQVTKGTSVSHLDTGSGRLSPTGVGGEMLESTPLAWGRAPSGC